MGPCTALVPYALDELSCFKFSQYWLTCTSACQCKNTDFACFKVYGLLSLGLFLFIGAPTFTCFACRRVLIALPVYMLLVFMLGARKLWSRFLATVGTLRDNCFGQRSMLKTP